MADFPGKVSTQTSSASTQSGPGLQIGLSIDQDFIRTIPGILLLAEIVVGLLVWALIASTAYTLVPAYGWVMFVSVTLWLLTILLFITLLLRLHLKIPSIPWPLTLMVFYAVATVLYLTAFLANAASVFPYSVYYNHFAAAAFFGIGETIAYGASTFFSYLAWRGDGGNAAGSTVPV